MLFFVYHIMYKMLLYTAKTYGKKAKIYYVKNVYKITQRFQKQKGFLL